jgi:hypothetical protein
MHARTCTAFERFFSTVIIGYVVIRSFPRGLSTQSEPLLCCEQGGSRVSQVRGHGMGIIMVWCMHEHMVPICCLP